MKLLVWLHTYPKNDVYPVRVIAVTDQNLIATVKCDKTRSLYLLYQWSIEWQLHIRHCRNDRGSLVFFGIFSNTQERPPGRPKRPLCLCFRGTLSMIPYIKAAPRHSPGNFDSMRMVQYIRAPMIQYIEGDPGAYDTIYGVRLWYNVWSAPMI